MVTDTPWFATELSAFLSIMVLS